LAALVVQVLSGQTAKIVLQYFPAIDWLVGVACVVVVKAARVLHLAVEELAVTTITVAAVGTTRTA
jgi:hypothetical protein